MAVAWSSTASRCAAVRGQGPAHCVAFQPGGAPERAHARREACAPGRSR
jgi:hypothetical protein